MLRQASVLLLVVLGPWGCSKEPTAPAKAPEPAAAKPAGSVEAKPGLAVPIEAPKVVATGPQIMGGQPALTEILDAENTILFVGVERVDKLVEWAIETGRRSPLGATAEFNQLLNPTSRVAFLGFDPTDPFAWAISGLDPNLGAALVLDRRLIGARRFGPVLLLKITNREKLAALMEKIGFSVRFSGDAIEVGSFRFPVREFRGWTAVLLATEGADALKGAFERFTTFTGKPLLGDALAANLLKIDSKGFRLWAYGSLTSAVGLVPSKAPRSIMVDLAKKFPALSLRAGPEAQSLRLWAEPRTAASLRRLLTPVVAAPNFAQYLRGGRVIFRMNLNLTILVQTVVSILPRDLAPLGTELIKFQQTLPKTYGITTDDVGFAFTGHFALSVDPKGAPPVLLIGLRQPGRADVVVRSVMTKLQEDDPKAKVDVFKDPGLRGFRYQGPNGTWFTSRRGKILAIAPTKDALRATFAGIDTLMIHPASKALTEPMAFMVWSPMEAISARGGAAAQSLEALWKPYANNGVLITRITSDDKGLLAEGTAFEVVIFVAAAVSQIVTAVAAAFGDAQAGVTMQKLEGLKSSVRQFELRKGRLPTNAEGLGVVFGGAAVSPRMTADDWGRQIQYFSPARKATDPKSFELVSWGADGLPDSPDDLQVRSP